MITETGQEILEKLWLDTVEGDKDSVKLDEFSDESVVRALEKTEHILISGNSVKLSSRGYSDAEKVIRSHRLAERLLHDVLDVGMDDMETSACKLEHVLSKGVEESICVLLGHPKECPHGKPIPQDTCCKEGKETAKNIVSPLSKLRKGQHGKVIYISTKNHENMQKLLALGILPGMPIQVIQTYPSYVFQVGETQIAVDVDIADDIFVRSA